ncbi:ATP-binding protein [Nocardia sp. NPDC051030]|uniref:ATP-binding protein n=1 Tax=Nocardia sp. NPDC051030 TaxID=3155162 RepID=UPI00342F9620
MSQQPTLAVAGNLRWTRSGTVYADYVLTGVEYGFRPVEDKTIARTMHKMLLRALPGESMLLGLCASLSPEAVVERMRAGVNLSLSPAWTAECEATLASLHEFRPGARIYWLSIPLANTGWKGWLRAAGSAATVSLTDTLGLPRPRISDEEIAERAAQAQMIVSDLPGYFRPVPATAAQMVWLHQHALQRGLSLDPDLPTTTDIEATARKSGAAFTAARLDEGAQNDVIDAAARGQRVRRRPSMERVLKVDQPWADEESPASYQSFMVLSDAPAGGMTFPGAEYLTLADHLPGVDVDWALLLHQRSREEVAKRNKRALVNLNDQFFQREGELSHAQSVLATAAEDLASYANEIESDKSEVEIAATTIFAVGAPTKELAVQYRRHLMKLFEQSDYRLVAPLGFQTELFLAMMPGVPRPRLVNEFAQITTSHHASAFVPCIRNDLGDRTGPLFALNITSPRIGVVHYDPATKTGADISGCIAITGNLGSGKSVAIKKIAGDFADRGGRVICVDHTSVGEYAAWAQTIATAVIVDPSRPRHSIDPLRMFGPERGAEIAASILLPLLQIQPDEADGVLLTEVLSPKYRLEHDLLGGGLYELVGHLQAGTTDPAAVSLARKMGVYLTKSYARSLFAPDLPALETTAPVILFRTHTVRLPSEHEVATEHLYKGMNLEKRFGRALYALIALIGREICFADPSEQAMLVLDECHRLTQSDEGADIVIEFLRESRKHGAVLVLGTQDPDEGLGNETMRGLIPTKMTMRQRDETLARKALRFVGLDPEDPALLKALMEETSPISGLDPKTGKEYVPPHRRGEGYMQDAYGNIGRIKVLLPAEAHRQAAVLTTPDERRSDKELVTM